MGKGFARLERELAAKVEAGLAKAVTEGKVISGSETFVRVSNDVAQLRASAAEREQRKFTDHLARAGRVVVGTVGGLIAGGPAGAAAGFVAAATAGSNVPASPGVVPAQNINVGTPPITPGNPLPPSTAATDTNDNFAMLAVGAFALFYLVKGRK